jgi:ubiquinone/menaquinone biosynthesis C-methylase UbiE
MTIPDRIGNLALRRLDTIRAVAESRSYKRQSLDCLKLAPGDCFLDVGCGTSDDVMSIAPIVGAAGKAVGVDMNPAAIAEAWRRAASTGLAVEFSVASVEDLPFRTNHSAPAAPIGCSSILPIRRRPSQRWFV